MVHTEVRLRRQRGVAIRVLLNREGLGGLALRRGGDAGVRLGSRDRGAVRQPRPRLPISACVRAPTGGVPLLRAVEASALSNLLAARILEVGGGVGKVSSLRRWCGLVSLSWSRVPRRFWGVVGASATAPATALATIAVAFTVTAFIAVPVSASASASAWASEMAAHAMARHAYASMARAGKVRKSFHHTGCSFAVCCAGEAGVKGSLGVLREPAHLAHLGGVFHRGTLEHHVDQGRVSGWGSSLRHLGLPSAPRHSE